MRVHERGELCGIRLVFPERHVGGRGKIKMISQSQERPPVISLPSLPSLSSLSSLDNPESLIDYSDSVDSIDSIGSVDFQKRLAKFRDLTNARAALCIDSPNRMTIQ